MEDGLSGDAVLEWSFGIVLKRAPVGSATTSVFYLPASLLKI